jgi:signal recognition particle subunit SRP54
MPEQIDDRKIKKIEAMILSMTPQERHNPEIIDGRRKRRIARGSGTTSQDVNQLLNMFRQTQKLMKQMARGKGMGLLGSMFR